VTFTGLTRSAALLVVLAAPLLTVGERPADACRLLDITFTPAGDPQIVIWLEDPAGNVVDTLYISETTGTYGLANRPGRFDFNSDWLWPYGRRVTVFPVWAHRRGVTYPSIEFQSLGDDALQHPLSQSSQEFHYCQPLCRSGPGCDWNAFLDAGTCATKFVGTDKGVFARYDDGGIVMGSVYPPRNDVDFTAEIDSLDVTTYADWNDLDAVSRATPPSGMSFTLHYTVPATVPNGDYIVRVEASTEQDQNEFYDYPSPVGIAFAQYGVAYRGQPSVVWSVPITIDNVGATADTLDYEGYGDPDGLSGTLFAPDNTITTTVEGSGAGRLLMADAPSGSYRVLVTAIETGMDLSPPAAPADLAVQDLQHDEVTLSFLEPGDDGTDGPVTQYEVRYLPGRPLDESNFTEGTLLGDWLAPGAPLQALDFTMTGLLPQTTYTVGVRAHDDCAHTGPASFITFTTPRASGGDVSACFVATAAHGSPMAAEVVSLRAFRDEVLRRFVLGELIVESYYTVGPALAEVVRPSESLRALTRQLLAPFVGLARRCSGPVGL
jgi:hypothetical protein